MTKHWEDISYERTFELSQYPAEYRIVADDRGKYGVYDFRNGKQYSYIGAGWTLNQAVEYLNNEINGVK